MAQCPAVVAPLVCSPVTSVFSVPPPQAGRYRQAIIQYKKITQWLEHESGLSEEEAAKSKSLLLAASLNLAACYLKVGEHRPALEHCNKVRTPGGPRGDEARSIS